MQRRQVIRAFPAFTLRLDKQVIPKDAVLEDFRIGLGHEGLRPEDYNVASFHYEDNVYFNLIDEVVPNIRLP